MKFIINVVMLVYVDIIYILNIVTTVHDARYDYVFFAAANL